MSDFDSDEEPRRYNTRNKNRRSNVDVDPTLYLGYCEDFETPAMIMKKFEELAVFEQQKKEERKVKLIYLFVLLLFVIWFFLSIFIDFYRLFYNFTGFNNVFLHSFFMFTF